MGGASTEDVEGQAVEDHADHQHHAVTHLQWGRGGDREFQSPLMFLQTTFGNNYSCIKIE